MGPTERDNGSERAAWDSAIHSSPEAEGSRPVSPRRAGDAATPMKAPFRLASPPRGLLRATALIPRDWPILNAVLFFAAVAFLAISPAQAYDDSTERATLKGLSILNVAVLLHNQVEAENPGLRSQIQTDVESRLRKAGIRVDHSASAVLSVKILSYRIWPNAPDQPALALRCDIELFQRAILERDPRISTSAITWAVGWAGVVPDLRNPDNIRFLQDTLAGMVDMFVSAYLEQNPKQ